MRVGSMFAGIGGICLGLQSAGARIVWANEIDSYCCTTYRHNFGGSYLIQGDIRRMDMNAVPEVDILTAGFPCQPFSIMGNQQGFADPRGTMYFEILRVIDAIRPQMVLLENVKNLVQHDNGRTFMTIYNTLAERDYGVKYSILGAHTHANLPQYRDRLFILAFLNHNKLESFRFPREIPLTKKINDIIDRNEIVDRDYYYGESNSYYPYLIKRMQNTEAIYRIDDSGIATRAWNICPTLKANMGTYHDRVPLLRDQCGIRKLTPGDCLALQGFPETFEFPKIPLKQIYKQIGNTVCVPVVERIAQNLICLF